MLFLHSLTGPVRLLPGVMQSVASRDLSHGPKTSDYGKLELVKRGNAPEINMKTKTKAKIKMKAKEGCGILSIWSTTQDMQRQGVICVALGNFLISHGNGVKTLQLHQFGGCV